MGPKPNPLRPKTPQNPAQYFLLLASLLISSAAASRRTATSCAVLKRLLADELGPEEVRVEGALLCDRATWGGPVEVRRNVTVSGAEASGGGLSGIDWSDARKAVVAGEGAWLTFRHLVLVQDEMGINGIDLSFFACGRASRGLFSDVVVGVRSCPGPVEYFSKVVSRIERPGYLAGEQQVTVVGTSSILVDDVGVQMIPSMAVWRLCSVAFRCGVVSLADAGLADLRGLHGVCGEEQLLRGVESPDRSLTGLLILKSMAGVAIISILGLGVAALIRRCCQCGREGGLERVGEGWGLTELVNRVGRGS